MGKGHAKNEDTLLAKGTANEISANTITHYFNTLFLNSALTMFRVMSASALTIQKMIDGIVDEFEDETGVNTGLSSGEKYYSVDDYYTPTPTYTETDLLIHANGTDGSTDIVDETGKTVVVTGTTVELDTAQEKFGLSSIIFGGSGAVEVADDDTLDLEAADWQYDFWFRMSAWPSAAQAFFSKGVASNNQVTFYMDTADIGFYAETNPNIGAAFYSTPRNVLSLNTWHHMRVQRVGSIFQIFIDGTSRALSAVVPITGNLGNFASPLYIGKQFNSNMYNTNMWIDEFKFSKGGAYSTSDFSVPTEEYNPSSSSDMVLISNSADTTSVRDEARIIIFEEDVDSITINTDLKAFVSRDNGTTFTEATLVDEGGYDATRRILACTVDISSQPTGTDMLWKIESHNAKVFKIHGVSLFWR